MTDRPITIYTDGSCKWTQSPHRNPGGWSFIVLADPDSDASNVYRAGYCEAPQTSQTMELIAGLNALDYVKEHQLRDHPITIFSDSTYLVNGMMSQFRHLLAAGTIDAPNSELWLLLHRHAERCKRLKFLHVKGHAGDVWNEQCDRMASKARLDGIKRNRR